MNELVTRRSPRAAGLLVAAALTLGACTHGDQGQIDALVRDYIDAFAHHDVQRMAADISPACNANIPQLQQQFAIAAGHSISVDVASIDVTMLTSSTATVTANGTATVDGHAIPLNGLRGQNRFDVAKVNGAWKIATCPSGPSSLPAPSPAG